MKTQKTLFTPDIFSQLSNCFEKDQKETLMTICYRVENFYNDVDRIIFDEKKYDKLNDFLLSFKDYNEYHQSFKKEIKHELFFELATRSDIEKMNGEIKALVFKIEKDINVLNHTIRDEMKDEIYVLGGEIKSLDKKLSLEIETLRNELKGDIETLRNELKGDVKSLENNLKQLRNELKGDNETLRNELKGDDKSLENNLKQLRNELKGEMDVFKEEIRGLINSLENKFEGIYKSLANEIRGEIKTMYVWQKIMLGAVVFAASLFSPLTIELIKLLK